MREGKIAHVQQHDDVDHEHHHRADVDQHLEHGDDVHAEEGINASERKHRCDESQRSAHWMSYHEHHDRAQKRRAREKIEKDRFDHVRPAVFCRLSTTG